MPGETEIVRRYCDEFFNNGSQRALEELVDDQVTVVFAGRPAETGREALQRQRDMLRAAFPDARWELVDTIAEGERVAVRLRASGTHRQTFLGVPATGRLVAWDAVVLLRVTGGRIVEDWALPDLAGLQAQLS